MTTTTAPTCSVCGDEAGTGPIVTDTNGEAMCDACIGDTSTGLLAKVYRLRATADQARNDPRANDAAQQWLKAWLLIYAAATPMPAEPDEAWWAAFRAFAAHVDPTGWAAFLAVCADDTERENDQ